MSEELVTVQEAAKILKVRRETIRRYIKNGLLKAATLPFGDYRLREKDIQKLLKPSCSKIELGYKLPESEKEGEVLSCPRCGEELNCLRCGQKIYGLKRHKE